MSTLLFDVDSEFGHVVENTPSGVVYSDDKTPVDPLNLRPCFGCKLKINRGDQDPCIANLPGTYQACCGHGLAFAPRTRNPNGYAALDDGRRISFEGTVGGERIRAAVAAALAGEPLPEGFTYDETRMWWDGLTEAQVSYVRANMLRVLEELVRESGATPSEAFLAGKQMWWDGLTQTHKDFVLAGLRAKIAGLVREALALHAG